MTSRVCTQGSSQLKEMTYEVFGIIHKSVDVVPSTPPQIEFYSHKLQEGALCEPKERNMKFFFVYEIWLNRKPLEAPMWKEDDIPHLS